MIYKRRSAVKRGSFGNYVPLSHYFQNFLKSFATKIRVSRWDIIYALLCKNTPRGQKTRGVQLVDD
jgi:hypothetical protein